MNKVIKTAAVASAALVLSACSTLADKTQSALEMTSPWQENYAKSKSEQASIYGFPYVFNYFLLYKWSLPGDPNNDVVHDAANQFYYKKTLANAKSDCRCTVNNDTLYTFAFIYVKDEPVILSAPAMEDERYWTVQLSGFDSDNFAYIGSRTTGQTGGNYAIVPKGWQGELPSDVTYLAEAPTDWNIAVGRTLVKDESDVAVVNELQTGYQLTALSDWGKPTHSVPKYPPIPNLDPEYNALFADTSKGFKAVLTDMIKNNPDRYLAIMNKSMQLAGVEDHKQADLAQFNDIGIGLDVELDNIDSQYMAGRAQGASLGVLTTVKAFDDGYGAILKDGWRIFDNPQFGRAGDNREYLLRASMQSLAGFVANDPEEAVYIMNNDDPAEEGVQFFSGEYSYTLHFDKDELPDVDAFWSLTMYNTDKNLVENELNRYSIGDRTDGIQYDDEGGLTIYVSHDKPDASKVNNWLPAPKDEFYVFIRTYLPADDIITGNWAPPAIQRVD